MTMIMSNVLGNHELRELTVERILGILVQNDLKIYHQGCQAANNGNTMLDIIS